MAATKSAAPKSARLQSGKVDRIADLCQGQQSYIECAAKPPTIRGKVSIIIINSHRYWHASRLRCLNFSVSFTGKNIDIRWIERMPRPGGGR